MTDILLLNNDLYTQLGDLATGYSDNHHKELLLITANGEWKQNPDVGVGTYRFLEAENPGNLMREIRQQYSADGMDVLSIIYEKGKLNIDANYRTA